MLAQDVEQRRAGINGQFVEYAVDGKAHREALRCAVFGCAHGRRDHN